MLCDVWCGGCVRPSVKKMIISVLYGVLPASEHTSAPRSGRAAAAARSSVSRAALGRCLTSAHEWSVSCGPAVLVWTPPVNDIFSNSKNICRSWKIFAAPQSCWTVSSPRSEHTLTMEKSERFLVLGLLLILASACSAVNTGIEISVKVKEDVPNHLCARFFNNLEVKE